MNPPTADGATAPLRTRALDALGLARDRVLGLAACLDDRELAVQHSPLMSPLVWDMAHIANQEEQWLLRAAGGLAAIRPEIDSLYDAFEHPRAERPALPLLPPGEARGYLAEVRGRAVDVLETARLSGAGRLLADGFVFGMIAQHEQQHAETMLITHQLRRGPAALTAPPPPPAPPDAALLPAEVVVPGGLFTMGADDEPWALDNERPAHRRRLPAFAIDTVPVTNAAYRLFIEDGGYRDPRWWAPAGWEQVRSNGWRAPLFWREDGAGGWWRRRFGVSEPVPDDEPVLHVSWYEADAYARWARRRLPSEAEWEKAARYDPATGGSRRFPWGETPAGPRHANLGQRHLRPAPAGSYPDGASATGGRQLLGDVWEWTASDFGPYPGFVAFPYREYSEVFFGPAHKVLRGGGFGVGAVVARATFRNWDYPVRRQIFSGFRTARSLSAEDG
ncbi:ergothioneine biosynthesis protein EgtB [Streptomyces axinellae]